MNPMLTIFLSPPTVSTLLPVVKTRSYTSGISSTYKPPLENSTLVPPSTKLPSTPSSNGSPLVLIKTSRSSTLCNLKRLPSSSLPLNLSSEKPKPLENQRSPLVPLLLGTLWVRNYSLVSLMVSSEFSLSTNLTEFIIEILKKIY